MTSEGILGPMKNSDSKPDFAGCTNKSLGLQNNNDSRFAIVVNKKTGPFLTLLSSLHLSLISTTMSIDFYFFPAPFA